MTTLSTPATHQDDVQPSAWMRRVLRYGIGMVCVAALLLAARVYLLPPTLNGIVLQSATPAYNFLLESSSRKAVTLHDFQGKYVLLSFGYSSCPDVCPMQLADLKQVVAELGDKAEHVQVLFVSVDPERDTAERLAAYLAHFDPAFVGLTGSADEIAATATAFGIYYQKSQPVQPAGDAQAGNSYFMDHTSTITVVDPEGYVRILYPNDTSPSDIAADLAALIW